MGLCHILCRGKIALIHLCPSVVSHFGEIEHRAMASHYRLGGEFPTPGLRRNR
jgi:hypothetical protein